VTKPATELRNKEAQLCRRSVAQMFGIRNQEGRFDAERSLSRWMLCRSVKYETCISDQVFYCWVAYVKHNWEVSRQREMKKYIISVGRDFARSPCTALVIPRFVVMNMRTGVK